MSISGQRGSKQGQRPQAKGRGKGSAGRTLVRRLLRFFDLVASASAWEEGSLSPHLQSASETMVRRFEERQGSAGAVADPLISLS